MVERHRSKLRKRIHELERDNELLRERVGELKGALEQIANAWKNMTYAERILGQPKASRLVDIADAALSSFATKQENQEESRRRVGKPEVES